MGHTVCVLGLFLLNILLYCGHAQDVLLSIEPNRSTLFTGESVTFMCDMREKVTDWDYSFIRNGFTFFPNSSDKRFTSQPLTTGDSGEYQCVATNKRSSDVIKISNKVSLTVSDPNLSSLRCTLQDTSSACNPPRTHHHTSLFCEISPTDKPHSVLTVSPLWLSPGDSVTLTCSVKHPSAGWRFFWFKAVPKLSDHYSYISELLPGSTDGTEQDSYIVHEQTHTAGYVCRAGRGDPVFYTQYSETKFVWSGDVHPAASLSVSPDRVQHFNKDSLSLSCEGNSTEWRVSRFIKSDSLSHCSVWGTMTGSTCNMDRYWKSGVFWCESETQFSNAANITNQLFIVKVTECLLIIVRQLVQPADVFEPNFLFDLVTDGDVILVSPVRPVTEGHSVTLGCKLKTENVLHDVDFYRNEKLIQHQTRGELIISAVTKSDEGFYKCRGRDSTQGLNLTSAESWLSVKYSGDTAASSASPVLLVVGLLCGVLLIILLLLFLYRCRKSTDSSVMRSQRPATDHVTQDGHYVSPLHGDAVLYETIKGSEEPEHDESGPTYSVVELRNIPKKRKNKEPDESTVYSDVKTASAADGNLLYAQVHPRTKDKKAKGKSRCAAAEEAVYSEVKPGARDQ
ncbi:uncharacterized protein LOC142950641 [Anarhichas minor]|uniref:uncharacterized protein LOC142950641 n=1 Tax=Anarhichas minor TaxID=65739 RepID=UPI003F73FFB1